MVDLSLLSSRPRSEKFFWRRVRPPARGSALPLRGLDTAFDFCCFHPLHGFIKASLHVFNPFFLIFNFSCVNFFVSVVHDGDVAVLSRSALELIPLSFSSSELQLFSFFFFIFLIFLFSNFLCHSIFLFVLSLFLVSSFRLNHSFGFFSECPCSCGVVHRWGDHNFE